MVTEHAYRWSGKVKGSPFSAIVDFRQKKLRLPLNLPSRKSSFVDLGIHCIIVPEDLTSRIPAQPAAIHIHINIDIDIALDMNGHVGRRNRLPQSRSRSDGGQKRDGDLERRRGCIDPVSQIGCGSVIARSVVEGVFDLVTDHCQSTISGRRYKHFPTARSNAKNPEACPAADTRSPCWAPGPSSRDQSPLRYRTWAIWTTEPPLRFPAKC